MEIVPAIERRAWLSIRRVESSAGPPERKAAMTITGNPRTLRKNTISPSGKYGPSHRMDANISAKNRVAATLQAIPRKGRSRPECGLVESVDVIGNLLPSLPGKVDANRAEPCRLEPAAALEIDVGKDAGNDDDHEGERIGPGLIELRHVMEVHAPDRSEQGRRQKHDRGHRHDLDDVVLLVVDEAQRAVLQIAHLRRHEGGVVL